MGATEIVQAFASPVEKLIEAVSGAIGKAYEPRHIRKMADAKAYEIEKIADAVRDNSDVPIIYNSTDVLVDTSNFEEIVKRASSRLAYQEIRKQQNIEAIADNAYEELENIENVSPEPINPDWMSRFFNSIEDISNEDLQKVWGRILAGEIKQPNTYSLRTLDKLKNMTQQEAKHFQMISSLALESSDKKFIFNDTNILNKYDVSFSHILEMEECGLMIAQELSVGIVASNDEPTCIYNLEVIGVISLKKSENQNLEIPVYIFTESGSQLIEAIRPKRNNQCFIECMKSIQEKYKDFVVTAHNINYITAQGRIYPNDEDLLSSEHIFEEDSKRESKRE